MRRIFDILRVRREERWLALFMLLLFLLLNTMPIIKYYDLFTPITRHYWPLFIRNYHVSGFDPITYSVVSDWSAGYNVYRHPLLAFYMYVPYLVNQALMAVTGINCAIFIVAAMQIACGFYSVLFMYRILREVVGMERSGATWLTLLFFSFAYVMLSVMVPDHFIISLLLLLIALYISGRRMISRRPFKIWQSVLYFLLTAGTSLNNGLKIFLAALFVNGRRFFRLRHLLLAVLLPSALIWGISRWEYAKFVWPVETERHAAKARMKARQKAKAEAEAFRRRQAEIADSMAGKATARLQKEQTAVTNRPKRKSKQGTPIGNGEFMRWTDISTSRVQSAVENLFGESIQLHQDYLLTDIFGKRPVIFPYRWVLNYVVEALVVLLFLVGLWCGRRSRFLWLCLSWFSLDMLLHMGLGFAINEIYIMAAHWIYIIPIAIGFLMAALQGRKPWGRAFTAVVGILALYLWIYNVSLVVTYMLG